MIDPNKHYSLYEIVTQKLIPGVNSVTQMSNIVRTDKVTNNWLDANAIHTPGGRVLLYQVKGANIIRYLAQKEALKD